MTTNELLTRIDPDRVPKHVAIIMDGNGRWAQQGGMERTFGHQNAISSIKSAINACDDLNIPFLSLYAFSTENWKRPAAEVSFLMALLSENIKNEIKTFQEKNIRLNVIGDLRLLPENNRIEIDEAIDLTKDNAKATLTIALSYGSKEEIICATKIIAQKLKQGEISLEDIDEELFSKHLYTHNIPDVDLLIRTSGEIRISNFMLWQIAYAELYFTPVLWPDFSKDDFYNAIIDYQNRDRRYGKVNSQVNS